MSTRDARPGGAEPAAPGAAGSPAAPDPSALGPTAPGPGAPDALGTPAPGPGALGTPAPGSAAPGSRVKRRRAFGRIFGRTTWAQTGYLLATPIIGTFWIIWIITMVSVGVSLAWLVVGLPIVLAGVAGCRFGADAERRWLGRVAGVQIGRPYRPAPEGNLVYRTWAWLTDPASVRDALYLVVLGLVGWVWALVALYAWALALVMVTVPAWFWDLPDRLHYAVFGANGGPTSGWGSHLALFAAGSHPYVLIDDPANFGFTVPAGILLLLAAPSIVQRMVRWQAMIGTGLLGPTRGALERRNRELTRTRGQAVAAAEAERRRIERDLHDGAQQRLVALAMDLGMARQKLASDPSGAEALLAEAHDEAKQALAELRDLARGIHPAILTERGLDAAVSALAARCPVPVTVDVQLPGRPPVAAESAAYFVVAEALTNIAKHAYATWAEVWARREGNLLVVTVTDDGVGGAELADQAGTGLGGLRNRVAALDGRLIVESRPASGTTIRAELPYSS
jgi:signal transduction histidine kinase